MRRWLVDLHLYLGLLSLPYVVMLGISSILWSHDVVSEPAIASFERAIAPPAAGAPRDRALLARDALGLRGLVPERFVRARSDGSLRFRVVYPARAHVVELDAAGRARVTERYDGLVGVIRALHGFHGGDVSAWGYSWALYTDLSIGTLLFFVATGAWLGWLRLNARVPLLATCALAALATAAAAAVIW